MLGTLQGWRRHHRHPGDTLVPSQSWGIKVGSTPGMGMAPSASLGSSRSWGVNGGDTPRMGTSLRATLGSLKIMRHQRGGHLMDGNVPNSHLGVPMSPSFCKAAWQRRYDEVIKSLLWSWRRKKPTESSQVSFQGPRNLKTWRGNLLAASRVCQQPAAISSPKTPATNLWRIFLRCMSLITIASLNLS